MGKATAPGHRAGRQHKSAHHCSRSAHTLPACSSPASSSLAPWNAAPRRTLHAAAAATGENYNRTSFFFFFFSFVSINAINVAFSLFTLPFLSSSRVGRQKYGFLQCKTTVEILFLIHTFCTYVFFLSSASSFSYYTFFWCIVCILWAASTKNNIQIFFWDTTIYAINMAFVLFTLPFSHPPLLTFMPNLWLLLVWSLHM